MDSQYPLIGTKIRGFQLRGRKSSWFCDLILDRICGKPGLIGWMQLRWWCWTRLSKLEWSEYMGNIELLACRTGWRGCGTGRRVGWRGSETDGGRFNFTFILETQRNWNFRTFCQLPRVFWTVVPAHWYQNTWIPTAVTKTLLVLWFNFRSK